METSWKIYTQTGEIWKLMLEDMAQAKSSIDIEQYCFWDDKAGHKFLEMLRKKNKEGVKVRVICDAFGSVPLFFSTFTRKLRKEGVEIVEFNPFRPWNFWAHLYRNHKKTMIVDGTVGWIGGVGLKKKFQNFRDTQVRITGGQVVTNMQNAFNHLWSIARDKNFMKELRLLPHARHEEDFMHLINGPAIHQKEISNWLMNKISNAEKYIYLSSPYFIPSKEILSVLAAKANDGLDVRLLIRGKNDEKFSWTAASSYIAGSLQAGIRVYRYNSRIMHMKTMVIDDKWASVGSTNLNSLSLKFSYEANIVSSNAEFAAEIKRQFFEDLTHSNEVVLDKWRNRPLLAKFLELLTWPMHNFL